jgi:Protein of unknown function (DUF3800)
MRTARFAAARPPHSGRRSVLALGLSSSTSSLEEAHRRDRHCTQILISTSTSKENIMHFFYLDETGCNGKDLTQTQQPIFVSGGIIVRDEGWNETHKQYSKIISEYFSSSVPEEFEFHTKDLFSPEGSGFFEGHDRDRRNKLIHRLLDLISDRKHQIYYCAINKDKVRASKTSSLAFKPHLEDIKIPYLIAYDYLISCIEDYTKEKLGKSARALLIIDKKDQFIEEIESITHHRRFETSAAKRIKWIAEFSYPIDSEKNVMIQLSDMCIFLIRKFLEIELGYKDTLPKENKEIFRGFYQKIHPRLISKKTLEETGKNSEEYNEYMKDVMGFPSTRWQTKRYA